MSDEKKLKYDLDKRGGIALQNGWMWEEPKESPGVDWSSESINIFAIKLPIAEVMNKTWADFDEQFKDLSSQADLFYSWAINKWFEGEPLRVSKDEKYVPQPKENLKMASNALYAESSKLFPLLSGAVRASILNKTLRKYRSTRFAVWRGTQARPRYGQGQPFPIRKADVAFRYLNKCGERIPVLDLPLLSGRVGNRFQFRLESGTRWGREHGTLTDIMCGKAQMCEVCLAKEETGNTHRHDTLERTASGDHCRVRTKAIIVVKCPKPAYAGDQTKIMRVATHKDIFLSLWVGSYKFQTYNAAHLHSWLQEQKATLGMSVLSPSSGVLFEQFSHLDTEKKNELVKTLSEDYAVMLSQERRRVQGAFSDDRKTEHRSGHCPAFNTKSARRAAKYERRTKSFCQQTVSVVTGHAKRRKVSRVVWSESDGRMLDKEFPWYKVTELLKTALNREGISFDLESALIKKDSDASGTKE